MLIDQFDPRMPWLVTTSQDTESSSMRSSGPLPRWPVCGGHDRSPDSFCRLLGS